MQTHPFKTIIAELAHLAMQIEEINRKPFGPGFDLHAPVSEDGESGDGEEVRLFASPGEGAGQLGRRTTCLVPSRQSMCLPLIPTGMAKP
jgi:hypothetical protein